MSMVDDLVIAIMHDASLEPPERRRRALAILGINLAKVAEELGKSRQHVHDVVAGNGSDAVDYIREAVAECMGLPVDTVFPERDNG
jgi:hypothetical protein